MQKIEKLENRIIELSSNVKISLKRAENHEYQIRQLNQIKEELSLIGQQVRAGSKKWHLEDIKNSGIKTSAKLAGILGIGMRFSSFFVQGSLQSGLMDEAGKKILDFGERVNPEKFSLKQRFSFLEIFNNALVLQIDNFTCFLKKDGNNTNSNTCFNYKNFDEIEVQIKEVMERKYINFSFKEEDSTRRQASKFLSDYKKMFKLHNTLESLAGGIDSLSMNFVAIESYLILFRDHAESIEFDPQSFMVICHDSKKISLEEISQTCRNLSNSINYYLTLVERQKEFIEKCMVEPMLIQSMANKQKVKMLMIWGFRVVSILSILLLLTDVAWLGFLMVLLMIWVLMKRSKLWKKILGEYQEFV